MISRWWSGLTAAVVGRGAYLMSVCATTWHRLQFRSERDSPLAVGDVEAVLQANLGAEMRVLGQLDLPIRRETRSPSPGRAPAGPRTSRRPPRR